MYIHVPVDRQTALIGDLMQRWDVYISIKAKQRQPIQSVIIKSIEQNMTCVYEARRRILDFSSQSVRSDTAGFPVGVANGKRNELESSSESGLTGSLSSVSEMMPNRSVQIPMSFSEDRLASKAGFTSSGSYTTMGTSERVTSKASFTSSGTLISGGEWEGEREDGEEGGSVSSPSLPPEITVYEPGKHCLLWYYTRDCMCSTLLMTASKLLDLLSVSSTALGVLGVYHVYMCVSVHLATKPHCTSVSMQEVPTRLLLRPWRHPAVPLSPSNLRDSPHDALLTTTARKRRQRKVRLQVTSVLNVHVSTEKKQTNVHITNTTVKQHNTEVPWPHTAEVWSGHCTKEVMYTCTM